MKTLSNSANGDDVVALQPVRHRGGQPGNRNGARTGIYSRPLQPSDLRRLDDLVEELRDALGSSYSVRFEAPLVVLAGCRP